MVGDHVNASHITLGYVYSNDTYATLSGPGSSNLTVSADGINDSGAVSGYYYDSSDAVHGFVYNNGTYTTPDGPAPSIGTFAIGIDNAGTVVGGHVDSGRNYRGFIDNKGTYTTLDDPPAVGETFAYGINNRGDITVNYTDASGGFHGFVHSNGTYTTLDAPDGVGDTIAIGINDSGSVSGYYGNSTGIYGFIATQGVPEPSSLILVGIAGAGGLVAARLRRRQPGRRGVGRDPGFPFRGNKKTTYFAAFSAPCRLRSPSARANIPPVARTRRADAKGFANGKGEGFAAHLGRRIGPALIDRSSRTSRQPQGWGTLAARPKDGTPLRAR